jgi:hypothetical protein
MITEIEIAEDEDETGLRVAEVVAEGADSLPKDGVTKRSADSLPQDGVTTRSADSLPKDGVTTRSADSLPKERPLPRRSQRLAQMDVKPEPPAKRTKK